MIKRILNPEDFKILADDIFDLHEFENEQQGHFFLNHNKETIVNSFANKYLESLIYMFKNLTFKYK